MRKIERISDEKYDAELEDSQNKRAHKRERLPHVFCQRLYEYADKRAASGVLPQDCVGKYYEHRNKLVYYKPEVGADGWKSVKSQRLLTYSELAGFLKILNMSFMDLFQVVLPKDREEWELMCREEGSAQGKRKRPRSSRPEIPPMPKPPQPPTGAERYLMELCDGLPADKREELLLFSQELSPERWRSTAVKAMPPSYRVRQYLLDCISPLERVKFMVPVDAPGGKCSYQWPEAVGGAEFAKLVLDAYSYQVSLERIPAIAELFHLPLHWIMMGNDTITFAAKYPQTEMMLAAYAFASAREKAAIRKYAERLSEGESSNERRQKTC